MELNIVASPSPTGNNAAGKKPARFVKRGRFKAKREQQKAATAATGGLGNLRIKETPLVGPDPVVKKKEKGAAAATVPSSSSSSCLVAGKKRKLAPSHSTDSGESEKKMMTKVVVPPVASTDSAAPTAAPAAATTAPTAGEEKKPKQAPHQPKTVEAMPKSKVFSSSSSSSPSKPKPTKPTITTTTNNKSSPPQHPTRRDPAPVSAARTDEYHMKPSQIDATLPLPTKSTTAITTGSSSSLITKGKSSKHIFTATPFSSLGLHDRLVSLLGTPKEHHGFGLKVATRVQSATLPALLSRTRPNALLCSETGSGKTLAYLLPLLQYLQALSPRPTRSQGTRAVIVAPTRELCHQIYEVLSRLVRAFIWVVPGIVVGGEKRKSEKARLRRGVMVLVGTPGRLLDHLQNTQSFGHEVVEWLVLDEVDRLVDLGFETQVREIVSRLRGVGEDGGGKDGGQQQRTLQVMAASATLSPAIDKFGRELLGRHVRIDAKKGTVVEVRGEGGGEKVMVGGGGEKEGTEGEEEKKQPSTAIGSTSLEDERFTTPEQLVQQYMVVTCKLRLPALSCFLRVHASTHKTVVFFSTCDSVDFHHALFQAARWPGGPAEASSEGGKEDDDEKGGSWKTNDGFLGPTMPVYRLHGSIAQAERLQTFKTFSQTTKGVLFCTDVAARGLDLPAVDWIVQYDPPTEAAEYVHRVGRTARRGRKGHALLFLLPSEQGYLDVLKKKGIAPTPLSLQQTLFQATPPRFRRFRAPEEVFCLEIQQRLEIAVEKEQPQSKEEEKGEKQGGKMPAVSPPSLLILGRKAFQSFVRAYATHPVELKMIFAVRSLHLGHVAKSFALREPPTSVKVGKEVRKVLGSAPAPAAAAKPAAAVGSSDGAAAAPSDAKSTRKMMKQKQRNRDALSLDVRAQQAKRSSAGAVGGGNKGVKSKNVFNSMSEFSSG